MPLEIGSLFYNCTNTVTCSKLFELIYLIITLQREDIVIFNEFKNMSYDLCAVVCANCKHWFNLLLVSIIVEMYTLAYLKAQKLHGQQSKFFLVSRAQNCSDKQYNKYYYVYINEQSQP